MSWFLLNKPSLVKTRTTVKQILFFKLQMGFTSSGRRPGLSQLAYAQEVKVNLDKEYVAKE